MPPESLTCQKDQQKTPVNRYRIVHGSLSVAKCALSIGAQHVHRKEKGLWPGNDTNMPRSKPCESRHAALNVLLPTSLEGFGLKYLKMNSPMIQESPAVKTVKSAVTHTRKFFF